MPSFSHFSWRNLFRQIIILPIRGYQLLISPLLGNNCRFYPTCSSYMLQAIEIHGVVKGIFLGTKRILRCHPYSDGGIDPVPGAPCCCDEQDCERESAPSNPATDSERSQQRDEQFHCETLPEEAAATKSRQSDNKR